VNAIALPWPPYTLSPNARPHYYTKARAKKDYRQKIAILGRGHQTLHDPVCAVLPVSPVRKGVDIDNALASLKPAIDGLTDAKWWSDDSSMSRITVVNVTYCKQVKEKMMVFLAIDGGSSAMRREAQRRIDDAIEIFRSAVKRGDGANGLDDLLRGGDQWTL
jgi:Holliday junction resolvase RusA-like endonuclease